MRGWMEWIDTAGWVGDVVVVGTFMAIARDLKYVAYRAKPGVRVKAGAAHLLRVPGADHQTVTVRLEVTR